jgi:predicted Zn-dependent protease
MDGTTQIGAKLFPSTTRLTSDPADPRIPSFPFTLEGEKLGKTIWIDDGAVRTLFTRRTKNSPEPSVPFPTNLILEGGKMHLKELIASAKRAVLVNSVSHLAMTDPTNGLLGGMTRDGLFLIEDGKITSGLKNMRFSETPVYMLKGAVEMTQSEQRSGRESTFPMLVPAIGMASFTFSASTEIV